MYKSEQSSNNQSNIKNNQSKIENDQLNIKNNQLKIENDESNIENDESKIEKLDTGKFLLAKKEGDKFIILGNLYETPIPNINNKNEDLFIVIKDGDKINIIGNPYTIKPYF